MSSWDPSFIINDPLFRDVDTSWVSFLRGDEGPTLSDYARLLEQFGPLQSESGAEISFVAQGTQSRTFAEHYEVRIYERGEVQTRERNWHDFFNALTWIMFPKAKAAVNARHYEELLANQDVLYSRTRRSPMEHALSIYNENGVAIVTSSAELAALIREFSWKELFWQRREEVRRQMSFFVFGHALYEKFLTPYEGMTGPSLIFVKEAEFFQRPLLAQRQEVDRWLAADFTPPCAVDRPRQFSPFPILGFPGLTDQSERAEYYDNTDYFRPGRRI